MLTVARRLTLRAEHLSELSDGDLAAVLAGQGLTGYYPTLERSCDTRVWCALNGVTE